MFSFWHDWLLALDTFFRIGYLTHSRAVSKLNRKVTSKRFGLAKVFKWLIKTSKKNSSTRLFWATCHTGNLLKAFCSCLSTNLIDCSSSAITQQIPIISSILCIIQACNSTISRKQLPNFCSSVGIHRSKFETVWRRDQIQIVLWLSTR